MDDTVRFRKASKGSTRHLWVANVGEDMDAVAAVFQQFGRCEVRKQRPIS